MCAGKVVFDTKYNFRFFTSFMPYLDSNILSKIFYISVGSEILSITRTTKGLINMCVVRLLI